MPDPIPVLVLGRLAVDQGFQGRRIGSSLLRDALRRTLNVAESTGVVALLVHAISEEAKAFYLDRGFLISPLQPMTLCLPVTTIRSALEG